MDRQRLFEFLNKQHISGLMTMLAILISNNKDVFGKNIVGEIMYLMFFSSASNRCLVLAVYDKHRW
jgi:hypothetical protein